MKKHISTILSLSLMAVVASSCIQMMEDAKDVERVKEITVTYKINAATGFIPKDGTVTPDPAFSTKGVKVTFSNTSTAEVVTATAGEDGTVTVTLDPGVYSVGVAGTAENNGSKYYLNGNIPSVSLIKDVTKAEAIAATDYNITVRPAKVGSLILSEIYYCGIAPYYFRDQTYRIYNNGDKVEYLDGLCFAQLHPNIATTNLPVWPDEDGTDNYVYGLMVWQIPGNGTDYPLQPGESIVIAQEARDHTVNNANSYDNHESEWECNTGNATRDNADVANLPYIFYTSLNKLQWLTSVFGASFCIYKSDDGTVINSDYYSNSGSNVQHEVNKTPKYAKIPADWILDGVELLTSPSMLNAKRIPGFVDAGGASVGETYCGKTVSRKVISTRADGTPIYADTNNSTDDFQINDSPVLRRNGEKVPSWSNWYK